MKTQKLGIPAAARNTSDDHLIPAATSIQPTLIEQLARSHAAVLEKWNRDFHLDLRWHREVLRTS
jgi:hypothetical protein